MLRITSFILIGIFVIASKSILAQLPSTNIYQFEFALLADSLVVTNPRYLTHFNPDSYNNQVFAIGKDEILISSNWENEEQTDILLLNHNRNILGRITATDQSEYSPTLTPDGSHLSVIRVELDRNSSQVLWKYPIDRSNEGEIIIKDVKNIGYHKWRNRSNLALFLVSDPNKLILYNLSSGRQSMITENPGRCFEFHNNKLYYIHKLSRRFWHLKEFDQLTGKSKMVLQSMPNREDFAITEDGTFIMGDGTDLYFFRPGIDKNWKKGTNLESFGLKNISRLHIIENQLFVINTD